MYVLAIDSSGTTASAALVTEEKVLAEISLNAGYTHSQTLMPLVDSIIKFSGIKMSEIDFIACSSGPGSFTGLRIGAACAKGLAAALGIKMVNVSALDALAYNITNTVSIRASTQMPLAANLCRCPDGGLAERSAVSPPGVHCPVLAMNAGKQYKAEGIAVPIMDARRGEVYAAVYGFSPDFHRMTEYMADKMENIIELAKTFEGSVTFLGDGVPVHRELLEANGMGIAPFCHSLQRAACVGALAIQEAREGRVIEARDFKIFYIRRPQAEREYESRG